MLSSFDSLMRKILLIPARNLGGVLAFFLTLFLVVLMLVLWNVSSNISAGSTRYLEEISRRLANTMVNSVEGSAQALTAVGTAYEHNHELYAQDVQRLYERLSLEKLIFIDLEGHGHDLGGNHYDFSDNRLVMQATKGKDVVFDCSAIHAKDGSVQKKSHMALAVPIFHGDKLSGAAIADVGETWGNNFLNTVLMEGSITFTLFDEAGSLLIKSVDFTRTGDNAELRNIQNLLDETHQDQLESRIQELMDNPDQTFLHFNYSIGKNAYQAVLVPIREYNVYLLTISTGHLGIEEFVSLDRTITATLAVLILLLTALCVTSGIFYHYCRSLAFTDPVTGGMTNVRFELEFDERLHRALPGQYTFFIININKFKLFNDIFGRSEGDRLLRIFYNNIRRELPSGSMLVCRSGIDEFDLLVANMSVDGVFECLDRAVAATMYELTKKSGSLDYSFSVRVGAHTIDETSSDYVNIKDRANIAMERARRTFSNNVRYGLFDEEDMKRARRERSIENSMQQSLDNEDFYIMLQPKVVLLTGCTCGAEALIRWYHPQLGRIYPNEFVPLFERNGFINKLDMWVFTKVCQLMQSWMKRGLPLIPISVNLSRSDIERKTNLADELAAIADSYGVPREFLDLEVTETIFYKDPAFIQKTVDSLRAKGFQCSLDDFGSGYSSLNLLPDLRVDTLKIDKSFFTSQELNRGRDRVVIKMVVELAHDLGLKVVAEGVETVAQRNFLCQCSCTVGQGFLYSKPVMPEEFELMTFGGTRQLC